MKIAIYDSGIGGLSVLHEAMKIMPNENYLYYADSKNVPYGTKSKEKVVELISESVGFIADKSIKALIVACNTATSVSIETLRKCYSFPIIGMEPAIKPAVENSKNKKILVIATPLTLKEDKFQNLIAKVGNEDLIDPLPAPGLVDLAEKFIFDEEVVRDYLMNIIGSRNINNYGTVVLGCTHFPFFKPVISGIFQEDVLILDGRQGTVKHLEAILMKNNQLNSAGAGKIEYYSSGKAVEDVSRYERYLKLID